MKENLPSSDEDPNSNQLNVYNHFTNSGFLKPEDTPIWTCNLSLQCWFPELKLSSQFSITQAPFFLLLKKMRILGKPQANDITNLHILDADDKLVDNSHKFMEALENNTSMVSVQFL
jgi:hypothetical protein